MKKRILAAVLAALMLLGLLTGCGGQQAVGGVFNAKDLEGLKGLQASKEKLTLRAHIPNFDAEKWDVYKHAEKITNIKIEGTVSKTQADEQQAFNLMMMAKPLPDIIYGSITNLNYAGTKEKIMVNLKPYVTDPKVMPNLAKILKEHPEFLVSMEASDGNIYVCPKFREPGPTQGWFTRGDWMDKLGLEHPTNYQEFVNVMDRMRNGDPNGNGKKDEIPFIGNYKQLFYFFGINGTKYWEIDKNDNMYMQFNTPEYKEALKTMRDWYVKGYFDQDVFTRTGDARSQLWNNNTGGMTFNWFSSTMSYNIKIVGVPGFRVDVMDPPANINGDAYCHSPGNIVDGTGWGISVDNKHVAATLRYFDYWYSDEGSLLNAMGLAERDYVYVTDDKGNYLDYEGNVVKSKDEAAVKYTERATNYEGGAPQYVRDIGCIGIGYFMRQKYLLSGMTEEAKIGQLHYNEDIVTSKLVPKYTFTAREQETITNTWTNCQTRIDEYMQQAILGEVDIDATYDAYVKELKDLGIDECAKVHNAAYDRYVKKEKAMKK